MTNTQQAASASPMPPGVTDPNYKPPPGMLGNLTVPQQDALDTLKRQLKEEGHFVGERMGDASLLRFLRACKFNLVKAKEMLLSAEQWRKDFGVDEIMKNFDFKEKAEVEKYYPQFYHKTDKDGRPIYLETLSFRDIKSLYSITTPERQLKRLVYDHETFINQRLPACSEAVGHPVEGSCTIFDVQNISAANFYGAKDHIMQALSISLDRYPECVGKYYIVNAPRGFPMVWNIIEPRLGEITVAKVDILGASYKDALLKQIDEENLPRAFGGKCDCPGGCSLSDAGPWNPKDELKGKIAKSS